MNAPATTPAGDREPLHALPLTRLATIRQIPAGALGGPMAIVEHQLPPGLPATPPQTHTAGDVWMIVLEGTLGARSGAEFTEAGPGVCLVKRRGQKHAFWNAGATPVRFVELLIPAN